MRLFPASAIALGLLVTPLLVSALSSTSPEASSAQRSQPAEGGTLGLTEFGPRRSLLAESVSGWQLRTLYVRAARSSVGQHSYSFVQLRCTDTNSSSHTASLSRVELKALADFCERFDGGGEPRRDKARDEARVSWNSGSLSIERTIQPLSEWIIALDGLRANFESHAPADTLRQALEDLTALEAASPAVDL